jgi:hypothetical protein
LKLIELPTTILAKGAYTPEAGYDTFDLSMPQYRVEALDTLKTTDASLSAISDTSTPVGSSKTAVATPNRAEKGAMAVAQAKAKKEAARAESIAKREALKEKSSVGTD